MPILGFSPTVIAAIEPPLIFFLRFVKEIGIVLEACQACAGQYGVSDKLRELGVDVKYMGQPLTNSIKEGRHVLTF